MKIMRRLMGEERGAALIMVGVALVMIFAFAVLAIDMSLIQLAKTQLQNAADAAALAGALEFAFTNGDHDAATNEAIRIAGLNTAIQDDQQPVVITAADVTFPTATRIRVETHRTIADGDQVRLFFRRVIGGDNVGEMTASAVAEVTAVENEISCLKPWMFPDNWDDANGDNVYDAAEPFIDANGNDQYDAGETFTDENKNGIYDQGEYYDPDVTGYQVPQNVGDLISLKLDNFNKNISPHTGWYYAVDFPPLNDGGDPLTGANLYEQWIWDCEPYSIDEGDWLMVEPGNMVGPTNSGLEQLIAQDPTATFNPTTGLIENSPYGQASPRAVKVATFDPRHPLNYDQNGRPYLVIEKIVVVFVEDYQGGDVTGRFMRRASPGSGEGEPGFLFGARLVE